jgi:hypothetical protein
MDEPKHIALDTIKMDKFLFLLKVYPFICLIRQLLHRQIIEAYCLFVCVYTAGIPVCRAYAPSCIVIDNSYFVKFDFGGLMTLRTSEVSSQNVATLTAFQNGYNSRQFRFIFLFKS